MATQVQHTQTASTTATPTSTRGGRRGRGRGRGGAAQAARQPPQEGEQPTGMEGPGRRLGGEQRGRGRGRGGRGGAGRGGGARGTSPPSLHDSTELTRLSTGAGEQSNSRRAQFGAALSNGGPSSSHLHASASSFHPSPPASGTSTPSTPAPVNQTLVERLTAELASGEAECSICQDEISRTARIHSCGQCSTPFHLNCIRPWAESSVAASAERAALLASRDPRNPPSPEKLEGSWSCPNCNSAFRASQIPKKYTCYCGRVVDPKANAGALPHSCARPCGRKRPQGCRHPCSLSCHPGPCPPCPVVLNGASLPFLPLLFLLDSFETDQFFFPFCRTVPLHLHHPRHPLLLPLRRQTPYPRLPPQQRSPQILPPTSQRPSLLRSPLVHPRVPRRSVWRLRRSTDEEMLLREGRGRVNLWCDEGGRASRGLLHSREG